MLILSDEECQLAQDEALEQLKVKYGENLNMEVLSYFASIVASYYNYLHYPLQISTVLPKELDYLGELNQDLESEGFSSEKLYPIYGLTKNNDVSKF